MVKPLAGRPAPGDPVSGTSAQQAARRELARPEYRHSGPSVIHRVTDWIGRQLGRLLDASGSGGHALLLVVVIAIAFAVVVLARSGLPGRRGRTNVGTAADPLAGIDAREHRRLASGYEADGRYAEALREWLRAAVATIEERGILAARPGRTGARTAAEAGPLLPGAAADLGASTTAFDEVWFGGRTATQDDAATAHRAADAVRAERARSEPDAATTPAGIAAPW